MEKNHLNLKRWCFTALQVGIHSDMLTDIHLRLLELSSEGFEILFFLSVALKRRLNRAKREQHGECIQPCGSPEL